MVWNRGTGDFSGLYSWLFISFIIFLTVFAVAYAQGYSSRITGLVLNNPQSCVVDSDCAGGEFCVNGLCDGSGGSGELVCDIDYPCNSGEDCINGQCRVKKKGSFSGSNPPQEVVDEMIANAEIVSSSADYASRVFSIIKSRGDSITQEELMEYRANIASKLAEAFLIYRDFSIFVRNYPSQGFDIHYRSIAVSIDEIVDDLYNLDIYLTEETNMRLEREKEQEKWSESNKQEANRAVEELETYVPGLSPSPPDIGPIIIDDSVVGECTYPTYLASFKEGAVDFGNRGIDTKSGGLCDRGDIEVYSAVRYNVDNSKLTNVPGLIIRPVLSPLRNSVSLYFKESTELSEEQTAVLFSRDENNILNMRFFGSLDYFSIEDKISEFTNDLLSGRKDVDAVYLSPVSAEKAESIINENSSIPWMLWIVLVIMILSFLFFERLSLPVHKILIDRGFSHLRKKDYRKAIQV